MRIFSAAIICGDAPFSEFLRIELKYLGAEAAAYSSGVQYDFLIVDLDTGRIPQGVRREKCLTFSLTDPSADLLRPFPIEELRSEVLSRFDVMRLPLPAQDPASDPTDELLITGSDAFFGGNALKLTKTELALLALLAGRGGELVSEDVIRQTVFPGSTGNAVQVYVRYLRQKLEKYTRVRYIERLRGQGYRLLTDGLSIVFGKEKEGTNG